MRKCPRNLTEFEANFPTEEACRVYLARLRWPAGFRCARCGLGKAWRVRGLWECAGCGYQTSVTAGTIFQDTRIPLLVWFRAMWWMTGQAHAASALELRRALGLKRYETAWRLLHKLRRAMVRPGRDLLTGRVEVDGCYVGGRDKRLPGRHWDKGLMVVAAEEDGRGIGRIRIRQIVRASTANLVAFVQDSVAPGSVIHTYNWRKDLPLKSKGYRQKVTFPEKKKKKKKKTPWEAMPRARYVISRFERWLMGTHQGAVRREHLDYYLDEFTFWFNLRQSQNHGELFFRLAQQAVTVDPVIRHRILHPTSVKAQPQSAGDTEIPE